MTTDISTVTGPASAAELGFTLMHEHVQVGPAGLYRGYPGFFGQHPERAATDALRRARSLGVDTIVDATTFDLGRDPELLAEVSRASGVRIIATTGWWLDVPRFLLGASANQLADQFVQDIEDGFRGTDVKAGMLKCAADRDGVTPPLEVMARAVARAHVATGVPIMVHSYPTGQVARRQIRIFREEGVDLTKVKIDHSNDTTDLEYLRWVLEQGCYLGLDRYPGRLVSPHMRTLTMKALIEEGYVDRLCPSHDCICLHVFNEHADGTMPARHEYTRANPDQFAYLHHHVIPDLLRMDIDESVIERLFVDNPRRFFGG